MSDELTVLASPVLLGEAAYALDVDTCLAKGFTEVG